MRIAFLHADAHFADVLVDELQRRFPAHEIISWKPGDQAPANDIEMLLAIDNVNREKLADQSKLAIIQTVGTGYENVDIDAATELGIWVSNAPSDLTGNALSVAEFAVLLMLGASRHLTQALQSVQNSAIEAPKINPALSGKSACIVGGLGSIGRLLIDRLRPFDMRISVTDVHLQNAPNDVSVFPIDQLHDAISEADYVVLCVRASKETENLIGPSALRAMKRGAIIVNVARGTLIDEDALFAAVESGHISAIGLDVVRAEPVNAKNPLVGLTQALVTPHIAGYTDVMLHGTVDYVAQVIEEFAAGEMSRSILNSPLKPRKALRELST